MSGHHDGLAKFLGLAKMVIGFRADPMKVQHVISVGGIVRKGDRHFGQRALVVAVGAHDARLGQYVLRFQKGTDDHGI